MIVETYWDETGNVSRCPECHGERTERRLMKRAQPVDIALGATVFSDCPCRAAARENEEELRAERGREQAALALREKARAASEVGRHFRDRTFANFTEDDRNKDAFELAGRVAHRVICRGVDGDYSGLPGAGFFGSYGLGKTHLAAAIVNACIDAGIPAILVTASTMVDSVWSSRTGAARRRYGLIPLLAIDDIGREPATANAVRTLLDIVNLRYEERLPVVITSNYTVTELVSERYAPYGDDGAAMIDRLRALTEFPWKKLTGKSRRGTAA